MVYLYLKDRANKDGVCWPSVNTIAADTKISAATVRRAVKDLRKAKPIETEQRYRYNGENSSLLYKLKYDRGCPIVGQPQTVFENYLLECLIRVSITSYILSRSVLSSP